MPVGTRAALLVPKAAVSTRSGIDFVNVRTGEAVAERAVITGKTISRDGADFVEVLTGLAAGDEVVLP